MGQPVAFQGSNANLGAPDGVENVSPLPVFRNGVTCVSCWQLSDEEVEQIVRDRRVFVSVFSGQTQPAIFVGSEDSVRGVVSDYGVWKR